MVIDRVTTMVIDRVTIMVIDRVTILPLVIRHMYYRGAAIHHLFLSDPTRVGDVTRIPCNAVPPDRGCH
jgi:hypothetical protein